MNIPNICAVSLTDKISDIKHLTNDTSDLLITRAEANGIKLAVLTFEGMASGTLVSSMLMQPFNEHDFSSVSSPRELFDTIDKNFLISPDKAVCTAYDDIIRRLMSGFAVIFIDGVGEALAFGIQGFASKAVSEPSSEGNLLGAHEGFTENVRTNMSLIRRRIKSPELRAELFSLPNMSGTTMTIVYVSGRVSEKMIADLKKRLKNIPLDTILGCGFAEPFITGGKITVFSGVSSTERPDVMCAALLEGRAGVLIDGTPFAMIVPALFSDNFRTLDDYNFKPYYASFIRIVRYAAFIFSVFLPGIYSAITMHHREILRSEFLLNVAAAEKSAPLPVAAEMAIVLLFYEIIREAGIRLPKNVGGAVSIIGGLVIGDTAVSAGIISDPVLLVCGISVISAFVIPSLNQPVSVLRLICTAAGGIFGLYGTALTAAVVLTGICSLESYGVPVTSPLSPFTPSAMKDLFIRAGFRTLAAERQNIADLNGSHIGG